MVPPNAEFTREESGKGCLGADACPPRSRSEQCSS